MEEDELITSRCILSHLPLLHPSSSSAHSSSTTLQCQTTSACCGVTRRWCVLFAPISPCSLNSPPDFLLRFPRPLIGDPEPQAWLHPTQNWMLVVTMAVSFLLQIRLIYIPYMQVTFQTDALPLDDLLLRACGVCSLRCIRASSGGEPERERCTPQRRKS
ncbi:hypothetical protein EDB89DRAFT_829277 [Lactarius sanguifluus]|nr:hypothetical protein EDB89DRAFT_829277 [Lactarius sanguifluus]